ncbi:CidA/LrgA family protein [Anaerobacillus sp. MEB173]|uniref:CidA/LrgA family protein n=1 Tax=Anaerobacillus sp. MEB173 TaxID=3383345 RepID=UPI003F8E3BDA
MKVLKIMLQIGILYCFYLIGTWIQAVFYLIIPGSIIGMLLLLLFLATKIVKTQWLESGASLLLQHMPLLFLPVTVGILNYVDVFRGKGFLLVIICLISTLIVMISSAYTSQYLASRKEDH